MTFSVNCSSPSFKYIHVCVVCVCVCVCVRARSFWTAQQIASSTYATQNTSITTSCRFKLTVISGTTGCTIHTDRCLRRTITTSVPSN
jgi:hypothetical protein